MVTLKPLDWSSLPSEEAIIPFPRDEVTPPVMKMYLVDEPIRMEERDDFVLILMGFKGMENSHLAFEEKSSYLIVSDV